ncbi:MAG: four helix bundle protein [Bacteroidales bacterium]|jgi:four helix bundle protein
MKYSFEKLDVWHDSRGLTKMIYSITKGFPDDEKFGITNQMRRSAISVSSNIVEGSYRATGKDKSNFMTMAYSSLMELLNQTIACLDLNYINEKQYEEIRNQVEKVSNKLSALTKYFKSLQHNAITP